MPLTNDELAIVVVGAIAVLGIAWWASQNGALGGPQPAAYYVPIFMGGNGHNHHHWAPP